MNRCVLRGGTLYFQAHSGCSGWTMNWCPRFPHWLSAGCFLSSWSPQDPRHVEANNVDFLAIKSSLRDREWVNRRTFECGLLKSMEARRSHWASFLGIHSLRQFYIGLELTDLARLPGWEPWESSISTSPELGLQAYTLPPFLPWF